MKGLRGVLLLALVCSSDAFRLGLSQRLPLGFAGSGQDQDRVQVYPRLVWESVRTRRQVSQELVRARPHLVHDAGWPQLYESPRAPPKPESANGSSPEETHQSSPRHRVAYDNLGVEDEMERMVHIAVPQDPEDYQGQPDPAGPEAELPSGPGAGDTSLEASGFYGTDAEDRERGDDGAEDRERRGGDEWDSDTTAVRIVAGQDGAGQDEAEQDGAGQDGVGQDGAGQDEAEQDGVGQDGVGQDEAEQDEAEQDGVGQDGAGQDEAEQDGVGQDGAGQDEAEQDGAGQDGAGQDRAGQDGAGQDGAQKTTERHDVHFLDDLESNHTSPDLDSLIGYSPSLHDSRLEPSASSLDPTHEAGLQEHRAPPVLQSSLDREAWEETQSSGFGVLHSSSTEASVLLNSSSPPEKTSTGTPPPETDTGTDFSQLGANGRDVVDSAEAERERELQEDTGLPRVTESTQTPTAPGLAPAPSRAPLQPQREGNGVGADGVRPIAPLTEPANAPGVSEPCDWPKVTEALVPQRDFGDKEPEQKVVCIEWTELARRGYVVLNMTKNFNCEEFRADKGVRLLRILEKVFARRMNSPEGSWVLYLSKQHQHQQRQLLMNVASEHGVIESKDVLDMLGEIRQFLDKLGIQDYSAPSSCQPRPSQTRSDYGKLFIVLVIIGSVCTIIITSGFIYICWQRRLPAKTTFRAEELHFVENACHDNPTLDVTNDHQGEMQEKKPSANGLQQGPGGGSAPGGDRGAGPEEGRRWQVFVNQAATEEEEEEQDTHL